MHKYYIHVYAEIGERTHSFLTELNNPSVHVDLHQSTPDTIVSVINAHAGRICSGIEAVSTQYIESQAKKHKIFLLLYRQDDDYTMIDEVNVPTVVGFIMASPTEDGGVYLDVVCSTENQGGKFMNYFFDAMRKMGASYIQLSSLISVLAFYPRLGFEHRKDCSLDKGADVAMSKDLKQHIDAKRKAGSLKEGADFVEDPKILKFIMDLHAHGFTVDNRKTCADRSISAAKFKQYSCGRDGFTMRKCFSDTRATPVYVVPFVDYVLPPARVPVSARHPATRRPITGTRKSALQRELKMLIQSMPSVEKGKGSRRLRGSNISIRTKKGKRSETRKHTKKNT